MIKKIIIACALIIPTVILTTILLTNTEKIGIKKNMVEQRFIVEGMVCTACETKVKESFSNTNIQVINVSYENKEALIKYNANKETIETINEQLKQYDLSFKFPPPDKLEVIDFKIKYN